MSHVANGSQTHPFSPCTTYLRKAADALRPGQPACRALLQQDEQKPGEGRGAGHAVWTELSIHASALQLDVWGHPRVLRTLDVWDLWRLGSAPNPQAAACCSVTVRS